LKFRKFKNPNGGGGHLGKSKNRHISAAVQPILTKFGKATQYGHRERSDR